MGGGGTIKMTGQTCRAHILPQIQQKLARGTVLTGAPRSPSRGLQTSEGREKSPCNWVGQENPRARSLERPHTGREVGQDGAALQSSGESAALAHGQRPATPPRPRGQPRTPAGVVRLPCLGLRPRLWRTGLGERGWRCAQPAGPQKPLSSARSQQRAAFHALQACPPGAGSGRAAAAGGRAAGLSVDSPTSPQKP